MNDYLFFVSMNNIHVFIMFFFFIICIFGLSKISNVHSTFIIDNCICKFTAFLIFSCYPKLL